MKSFHILLTGATTLMLSATACSSVDEPPVDEQGLVAISVGIDGAVDTRASVESMPLRLKVVSEKRGVVFTSDDNAPLPETLTLLGGEYRAVATVGDSLPASFTCRYFKGETTFTISAARPAEAVVNCRIANCAVAVNYTPEVDNVLHNYTLTVGHSSGSLTFVGRDSRCGYFMMPSASETSLTWTLEGSTDAGTPFRKTGVINDVHPATLYTLDISFNGTPNPMGGFPVEIRVDTRATEIILENTITDAPSIEGIGIDLAQPFTVTEGEIANDLVVGIASVSPLKSLTIGSDAFVPAGLPAAEIDFVSAGDDLAAGFLRKGIRASVGTSMSAVNLSRFFLSLLPAGNTSVLLTATDEAGMTSSRTINITVTNPQ